MSETWTIDSWLYTKLTGDTTLMTTLTGVFADVAPFGQAFPYGIIALQDAEDVMGVNGVRILTAATYQVRIVTDATGFGGIKAAADRIDTLLHRASGSVTGGVIISCVREAPLRYTELYQGKLYRHMGGLYRLQVQ